MIFGIVHVWLPSSADLSEVTLNIVNDQLLTKLILYLLPPDTESKIYKSYFPDSVFSADYESCIKI